jgi:3-phosphoshikimate 1-carboxyvinyltransferase
VTYERERLFGEEPVADIRVRHGALHPFSIGPSEVPALIDELPLIAMLAAFARGTTEVTGAAELKWKESDRLAAVADALRAIGADVEAREDGWSIHGSGGVRGGLVRARGDHRIAMAFLVAGLRAKEGVTVDDTASVAVSDPEFLARLRSLGR